MIGLWRASVGTLIFVFACGTASGATTWCIFVGAPGEAAYGECFHDWASRLNGALVDTYGVEAERVHRFPAGIEDQPLTLEAMDLALQGIKATQSPEDYLAVVLIGHGSDEGDAKFMVSGPDLSAETLRTWLDGVPTAGQLIVNTTSSSGGFIRVLSAPGRVVGAATQSGQEKNAPEFAEHLVRVLEEDRGDKDRNGRLSWGEWLIAGAVATTGWYEQTGYIASEHAVFDDNGDGALTRIPLEASSEDGAWAATIYIEGAAGLIVHGPYEEAIAAVEAWKAKKSTVDGGEYWTQLETLLLNAARLNPRRQSAAGSSP